MKRTPSIIALVAICATMAISCKNKANEPTPEEIQAQKVALADSVLAEIDALVDQYCDASSKAFRLQAMELTDIEKMVKPDYLLDPSLSGTFVTKSQKFNALVIYIIEDGIRKIYDMPREDGQEAIAKLAAELNYPFDTDFSVSDQPVSQKTKARYDAFKDRGELASFWQFEIALIAEIDYIISHNPDLFFSKISEEQWQQYYHRKTTRLQAIEKLAKYDDEVALLLEFRNKYRISSSDQEIEIVNQSKESAKQFRIANKDKFIAKRNALLQ